jgi:hypothetical protein
MQQPCDCALCFFPAPFQQDRRCWIPWLSTYTSPRRSLLSECHTVSRYTRKCNFAYFRKKRTAFAEPVLRNSQMLAVVVDRYLFILNCTQFVDTTARTSSASLSKVWLTVGRFSRNSRFLFGIIFSTKALKYNQVGRKMYEKEKIVFKPLWKISFYSTDFHETHLSSLILFGDILCWLLFKLARKYETYG